MCQIRLLFLPVPAPATARQSMPSEATVAFLADFGVRDFRAPPLAAGTFGKVYGGYHRGMSVALKVLQDTDPEGDWMREVESFKQLQAQRHPHVVELLGFHRDEDFGMTILAMPLATLDLRTYLTNQSGWLPVSISQLFVQHMFKGVHHLHRLGIIHRDLKPENMLVDVRLDGPCLLIGDLGSSRQAGCAAAGPRVMRASCQLVCCLVHAGTLLGGCAACLAGTVLQAWVLYFALLYTLFAAVTAQCSHECSQLRPAGCAGANDWWPRHLLVPAAGDVP